MLNKMQRLQRSYPRRLKGRIQRRENGGNHHNNNRHDDVHSFHRGIYDAPGAPGAH